MVGAEAVDLHPPDDLPRAEVEGDDVGEVGARRKRNAVGRGERVDVLVVTLADEQVHAREEPERERVGGDLGGALVEIRDDVQAGDDLQRARVDDVGGPAASPGAS